MMPRRERAYFFLASKVRLLARLPAILASRVRETPALRLRARTRTPRGIAQGVARASARLDRLGGGRSAACWIASTTRCRQVPRSSASSTSRGPTWSMITPLVGVVASSQLDLLRSVRARGVPAAVCVWSWDHLSSKAIIRDVPDRLFVWNDVQKGEALGMHGVPPERVVVTGAQCFDRWFDRQPARGRADFARHVGLPDDRPFVLWVCSALFPGSPSEAEFVMQMGGDPPLVGRSTAARCGNPHPSASVPRA